MGLRLKNNDMEQKKEFISKIISDYRNKITYNKTKLESIGHQFGIVEQNKIKEYTELAICILARELSHSNKDLFDKYNDIVDLYKTQTNLSHRTSESVLLQQYSTPAPIGYIAGVFCGFDKKGNYFEPSAGNGLLTIAGNASDFTVNEIDKIRSENLKEQGFKQVISQDASIPFKGFEKSFDAVITNPPFGKNDAVSFGTTDIKSLEQLMALRALETMKDDGKCAIIIGGHTTYDSEGRIQAGKNRTFFVYLYKNYNVVDVINIDGHSLYSRQGTAFNTRLILIDGRKKEPSGFPPLITVKKDMTEIESPIPVNDFGVLFDRVMKNVDNDNKIENMRRNSNVGYKGFAKINREATRNINIVSEEIINPNEPSHEDLLSVSERAGEDAFEAGKDRNAMRDIDFVDFVKDENSRVNPEYLKAWLTGFDQANLRKPITEITQPSEDVEIQNAEIKENAYIPQSDACTSVDTIVPISMRYDMHKAIQEIDERVEGIDDYVADKLGYTHINCSIEQNTNGKKCLCDAFSAEQVDAIAVAIYNIEQKGQGCIIGDQTGIGKGRIAAGMIRYAVKRGLKPIFLTEKPNLFSDLFRDVINIGSDDAIPMERLKGYREVERKAVKIEATDEDSDELDEQDEPEVVTMRVPQYETNKNYESEIIGKNRLKPFIVNGRGTKTDIKDEQGNIIYKGNNSTELKNIIASNSIPTDCDFVLGTYSQFRGANDSVKMQYLLNIAQGNVVIMDESHNASGSSNVGNFLKKCLEKTKGVVFLSATFAKRPDNMPIYASKLSMRDSSLSSEALVDAILKGGVALQEIVSSNLVSEGQMIRRERSFEGIEVNYHYLDASQDKRGYPNLNLEIQHKAIMDSATHIIRDIIEFQTEFIEKEIKELDKIQKAEYKEVEKRKGTKNAGVDNQPVFSGIFNVINQLLFSIKAEAVAEVVIQRLKEGKKPVIAFANTMESFLNSMTTDDGRGVKDGDKINYDFSKVLEKRLQSVLKYTIKDADGNPEYKYLDIETEVSEECRNMYKLILSKIQRTAIGISMSPIDVLTDKIEKAGYTFAEVTGRDKCLKLIDRNQAIVKSRIKVSANDAFRQFNNNEIDCLLINQSGSTGASAHAIVTPKVPKEQVKQRVMVILQAELNINTEVQKRGRINRTGQIMKPIYDYVISAIPAEKRLMMMLQKKLKSLDANTTSSQKQSEELLDKTQADFLNKYGDGIVAEYLLENKEINTLIGDPLKLDGTSIDKMPDITDASHRVSGRVAILSTKDQANFYSEISERYVSQLEYLKQTGEYDLEVEDLDLGAETIEKEVIVVGKGGNSVFGRHSILEKCTVNNLKKPFKKVEIDAMIQQSLNGFDAMDLQRSVVDKCKTFMLNSLQQDVTENEEHYDNLIRDIQKEKKYLKITSNQEKLEFIKERTEALKDAKEASRVKINMSFNNRFNLIKATLGAFYVGKPIAYPDVTYAIDGKFYKGIFLGFDIKENIKNPYAPSAIKLKFAIAGSLKYIAVPASKIEVINNIKSITYSNIYGSEKDEILNRWDDLVSSTSNDKTTRYIVTGNILQAFGKEELKGSLISYTTIEGGRKKGILLPESFDKKTKNQRGNTTDIGITVPIIKALPIIKSLVDGQSISTKEGFSIMKKTYGDGYNIYVPASKQKGGHIYLNETIMAITTEGTFNKISDQMKASVENYKIDNLIEYVQSEFGFTVELKPSQFDVIKDSITIEDYSDEVKMTDVDTFVRDISDIKKVTEQVENVGIYTSKPQYEIPAILKNFIPKNELSVLRENVKGEEGQYFIDMLDKLSELIKTMPSTYQTEGTPTRDKIVYLHYFYGGSDWYIVEKDKGDKDDRKQGLGVGKQHQAFGYTVLNDDTDMAEWGYISIEELIDSNVELDLYFTPTKFGELFASDDSDDTETVLDKVENKIELPKIEIGLVLISERGNRYFISELNDTDVSIAQEPEFEGMNTPNITSSWNELLNRVNSGKLAVRGFDSYDKFYFAVTEYLQKVELAKKDKQLSETKSKAIKTITENIKPIEAVEIEEPIETIQEPKMVTMIREPKTIDETVSDFIKEGQETMDYLQEKQDSEQSTLSKKERIEKKIKGLTIALKYAKSDDTKERITKKLKGLNIALKYIK